MKKLIWLLLFAVWSFSQPTISGISGTVSHDSSITISGNGFTTKSTAAPVLWDAVENISAYSGLNDNDIIPVGGSYPWPTNESSQMLYNTTSGEQRNTNSTVNYISSNNIKGCFGDLLMGTSNPPLIYISWWWWTDTDISGVTHSSKYLRCSNHNNLENATTSWTQLQFIVWEPGGSCGGYCVQDWNAYAPSTETWVHHEVVHSNFDTTYNVNVNNDNYYSGSYSPGGIVFDYIWRIGYDGGGESPPAISTRMDDIYIDTSYCRVAIGDSSTYSTSALYEMQIPSAWSPTSITVDINQGSFSSEDSCFLFVFDSTNTVSAGYPIVIGGLLGGNDTISVNVRCKN